MMEPFKAFESFIKGPQKDKCKDERFCWILSLFKSSFVFEL